MDGIQSSLSPAGLGAARISALFWWMTGIGLLTWFAVILLTVYCVRSSPDRRTRRRDSMLIIGGGAVVPALVLAVLLAYGLAMLPPLVARAPEGSLQIAVSGELWWWRVRYLRPGGEIVELANEIRLPVGQPVQFVLTSENVIHSFWIPSLGGKMDVIPGRVTHLALHPTRTGIFRGACAEYCGTSHAQMAFYVEVMEPDAFARWLDQQAAPAQAPAAPPAVEGARAFHAAGCGACHTVRGTEADGVIGPDLTHVGGRMSLAAGIMPPGVANLRRWIALTEAIKPAAHMPAFGMLPDEYLQALAVYLDGLK